MSSLRGDRLEYFLSSHLINVLFNGHEPSRLLLSQKKKRKEKTQQQPSFIKCHPSPLMMKDHRYVWLKSTTQISRRSSYQMERSSQQQKAFVPRPRYEFILHWQLRPLFKKRKKLKKTTTGFADRYWVADFKHAACFREAEISSSCWFVVTLWSEIADRQSMVRVFP